MRAFAVWLERAALSDAGALASLEERCFSHPWSAQSFREVLAPDSRRWVVVLRQPSRSDDPGRGILAYCVLETVADELQIHNLAVDPSHRGVGLGTWLLRFVLGSGSRQGAQMAVLEVRRSNTQATHLYHSLGFRTLSVRSSYYARPTEDALLLIKTGLP